MHYMHALYACLCLSHIGDRNQPNNQLLSRFIYKMFLYSIKNLLITITTLYYQIFSRLVKEANVTANLQACFFYNTSLYWITNLLIAITLIYWQFFLIGILCTNEYVCLNTHCVYSINNLLCEPITNT